MKYALILFTLSSIFGGDWMRVQVDERVSIEFPAKPVIKNEVKGNSVIAQDIDSSSRCMISQIDLGNFGLDSATVRSYYGTEEFLDQFKTGMLNKLPGCRILSSRRLTMSNQPVFEFVIEKEKPDSLFSYKTIYNRNVFVGSTMYTLYFYQKEGATTDQFKEHFFNSFAVK